MTSDEIESVIIKLEHVTALAKAMPKVLED